MKQEILEAIAGLHVLELRYDGYIRTVAPHAYGRDKSGDEILRCYQTGGGSASGEPTGWKLLKVADIYAIYKSTKKFKQHPEYRRGDKAMTYIFLQL
jgi:hypothetical protein